MTQKWVSVSDACSMLGISKSTLYRRINQGEIESKKEGKNTACLISVSDESHNGTIETVNETLQIRNENEYLKQQVTQLQEKLDQKDEDLRRKDEQIKAFQEQLAEASHRHDTVVMQLTKIVEYQQQPFWRKLFSRKALPPPEHIMDMEPGGDKAKE